MRACVLEALECRGGRGGFLLDKAREARGKQQRLTPATLLRTRQKLEVQKVVALRAAEVGKKTNELT